MVPWITTAVVGWATFQIGRGVSMWFRPRVPGARSSPVSPIRMAAALIIVVIASSFFVWNQTAKAYPFKMWHAGVLAACLIFGYQSIRVRQSSLQDEINSLARGVSEAFVQPLSETDRMKALVAVAMQNELIASKLSVAVFDGPESQRRTAVKIVDNELVDDVKFPNATPTSVKEKIDILLQEIGFSLLAKFGEEVMRPRTVEGGLTPRDWRHIKESGERTRALLDSSAIDWARVNDAVFHISEARLRRGIPLAELTAMEKRIREERPETTATASLDEIEKRGFAHIQREQWDNARQCFQEMLRLPMPTKRQVKVYQNILVSFQRQNRIDEAIAIGEQTLKMIEASDWGQTMEGTFAHGQLLGQVKKLRRG